MGTRDREPQEYVLQYDRNLPTRVQVFLLHSYYIPGVPLSFMDGSFIGFYTVYSAL